MTSSYDMDRALYSEIIPLLENAGFHVIRNLSRVVSENRLQLTITHKDQFDSDSDMPFYYPAHEVDTCSIIE